MEELRQPQHHHHSHGGQRKHHSHRAGANRETKSQKKKKMFANILFSVLSVIALAIVLFIAWDRWG